MTIDKSLQIISVSVWGYTEPEISEAIAKIKEEMGYRHEKPPIPTEGSSVFGEAKCPTCGNLVYRTEDACDKCGQLLDWIEAEEIAKCETP